MELVSGGSLGEVLQICGGLTEPQVALIAEIIIQALIHFHSRSPPIIHRDIKSDNVLVGMDGAVRIGNFPYTTLDTSLPSFLIFLLCTFYTPSTFSNTQ